MDFIQSIILGIVEGITEFLPVSSTGHLILTSSLLNIPHTDFVKSFEIFIQFGAILAVLILYWKLFLDKEILIKLAIAFIPTGIIGFSLYKIAKSFLGNEQIVIWALALGGLVLIAFELFGNTKDGDQTKSAKDVTYKQAFLIGIFQAIAIIPGVSRSAATIIGGQALGIARKSIVEFSFLLAVPTIAAASGLDLIKNPTSISTDTLPLILVGSLVSFLVAIIAIKFLLKFITTNTFVSFGIYRIVVAIAFWAIIL